MIKGGKILFTTLPLHPHFKNADLTGAEYFLLGQNKNDDATCRSVWVTGYFAHFVAQTSQSFTGGT